MSGTAVIEFLRIRIQAPNEQTAQRLDACKASNVAIDTRHDLFGIAAFCRVCADQADKMRDPHPRRQTFATDVAEREDQTFIRLLDTEEIARQMTNRKDLTRYVETAVSHQTRRTQSTMHLCGFEDRSVQLSVILLQLLQAFFKCH